VTDLQDSVDQLVRESRPAAAYDVPEILRRHAERLGLGVPVVFLADLQQQVLVPFVGPDRPDGPRPQERDAGLSIDGTLAGRAYQHLEPVLQHAESEADVARVWLPLASGPERLGVLSLTLTPAQAELPLEATVTPTLTTYAATAADLVTAKTPYGDTIVKLRRREQMGLAAEMQRSLLPPMTFSSEAVVIAGGLEPAYEVGGDSIDYAVDPGRTRFAIFDGMGHGLHSAQLAVLTVAAYRNARRSDSTLSRTARQVDEAVVSWSADGVFATGILAELDTDTGHLSWVSAGHPAPLLLRDGRLVKELHVEPALPFGLGADLDEGGDTPVGSESLEPGDVLLLYTDGVVEARSPEGDFFGQDRLVDLLTRNMAAGLPVVETMRRTVQALLEHEQSQLSDDATLMLVAWRTSTP